MTFTNAVDVGFEDVREVAFGSVGVNYAIIGAAFTRDIVYLDIYNGTNEDIYLSTDGTNNKKRLPAGAIWVWDIGSNQWTAEKPLLFKRGSALYQKYVTSAPTSGVVSLCTVFGS